MRALTMPSPSPEAAYRRLLGHTTTCAACRAVVSCPIAVSLGVLGGRRGADEVLRGRGRG